MYQFLPEMAKIQLRQERVAGLEADHYRLVLALEEARSEAEAARVHRDLAELERRLEVHHAALTLEEGDDQDEVGPKSPASPEETIEAVSEPNAVETANSP